MKKFCRFFWSALLDGTKLGRGMVFGLSMYVVIAVCSCDCRVAAVDSSSAAAAAASSRSSRRDGGGGNEQVERVNV